MTMAPMRSLPATWLLATVALVACCGEEPDATKNGAAPPPSDVAFKRASAEGKHLFILFFESDDAATQAACKTLDTVTAQLADKALQIAVKKDAPEETALTDRFGIRAAPLPLVLVLAPNGAVTLGCTGQGITAEKLRAGIASPTHQKCLKALQDGKVAILFVCRKSEPDDGPALRGMHELGSDPTYSKAVEIVRVDPSDGAETAFLKRLNIDPNADLTTLVLVPPMSLLKRFTGAVTKESLTDALKTASLGCGCGPGGCR